MRNEEVRFEWRMDSLEELADAISEVLECSVTIEDANHKLLAYSFHHTDSDPARISTIVGRRVPDKIIRTLWRDGIFQQIMKSERPVRIASIPEIGLGDRVAIAIRKDKDILGYIWIAEEKEQLDERGMNHLLQASRAATAKLLQLRMKHLKVEQGYQDFFWQLLSGQFKTEREVRDMERKYQLQLPALFSVNVLQFASEITESTYQQLRYMITTTLDKRIILHIINNDQLILLEDMSPNRLSAHANVFTLLAEPMRHRFGLAPVMGGCGLAYDNYAKVEQSYQEALTVIQLKQKFPQALHAAYHYADLGFYRTLPILLKEKKEHAYPHHGLQKLEQYDHKNNANLLPTLRAYLEHNSNMKLAADALHIHENTLSYRLRRISEVSGIDLNSMDEKVTCYLEMKLKAFAEN